MKDKMKIKQRFEKGQKLYKKLMKLCDEHVKDVGQDGYDQFWNTIFDVDKPVLKKKKCIICKRSHS